MSEETMIRKQVFKILKEGVKIVLLISGALTLIDSFTVFLNDEFAKATYLLILAWFAFWLITFDND